MRKGSNSEELFFFFCGCLWLASVVACVVVATDTAQASTSGDGELHRERTEANCCGRDRYNTSVNIWRRWASQGENRSQLLWSRQVRHRRQHLETVSFTGREPRPTVVVATGAV